MVTLLDNARVAAGMTHRQVSAALAGHKGCSLASVYRAATNHEKLPSRELAVAYAEVCGMADAAVDQMELYWEQAAANYAPLPSYISHTEGIHRPRESARGRQGVARDPRHITQPHEIIEAMQVMYAKRHAPTYRRLEAEAKALGLTLPRSTISDALRARGTVTWPTMEAFLTVMGAPFDSLAAWQEACKRTGFVRPQRKAQSTADLARPADPPSDSKTDGRRRTVYGESNEFKDMYSRVLTHGFEPLNGLPRSTRARCKLRCLHCGTVMIAHPHDLLERQASCPAPSCRSHDEAWRTGEGKREDWARVLRSLPLRYYGCPAEEILAPLRVIARKVAPALKHEDLLELAVLVSRRTPVPARPRGQVV
ncbi:hypothetical protein [Kitasatospora indigofera]|uniref:hypothetical protein n=1 Tax=Kitasatospora indigofera TaxID=67307 RepID=UPI0036782701